MFLCGLIKLDVLSRLSIELMKIMKLKLFIFQIEICLNTWLLNLSRCIKGAFVRIDEAQCGESVEQRIIEIHVAVTVDFQIEICPKTIEKSKFRGFL
jgi:hypothetical protein